MALALAYARYISCENKSDLDSCGTCKSQVDLEYQSQRDDAGQEIDEQSNGVPQKGGGLALGMHNYVDIDDQINDQFLRG